MWMFAQLTLQFGMKEKIVAGLMENMFNASSTLKILSKQIDVI